MTELFAAFGGEVSWRYVQYGLTAGLPFLCQAIGSPGIGNEDAGGEFRIGVQFQTELNDMVVLQLMAGFSRTDDKAAMSQAAVIILEFFFADEMDGGIIFIEVIRHGFDFLFHPGSIGAILQYYKAFARMLLAGRKLGICSGTDRSQGAFYRDGILLGVLYAGNAADSIGMSLADALAPKGIVFAGRQDCVAVHAASEKRPGSQPTEMMPIWPVALAA